MALQVTTHLNFRGRAREALEFYRSVFGGEQIVMTYGDMGMTGDGASAVMWGQVAAPSGFRIMAYDVQPEKNYDAGENAFYVALQSDDGDEIAAYWSKLAEGAEISVPLGPSAWSPAYGMLEDRFGTTWILSVIPADAPA